MKVNMLSKCSLLLLLMQVALHLTQEDENVFRCDYEYIPEVNSHYKIHTLPRTKDEAKAACELESAQLFFPDDENEAMAVLDLWNNAQPFMRSVFVSLYKNDIVANKGHNFLKWSEGEPNNAGGTEDCLVLNDDGTLNDENCNSKYPYICKKPHKTEWNDECHMYDLDYKYNEKMGRCYKIHVTPKNWTDAYTTCYREQSYLAVVDNDDEVEHLVDLISNTPVFKSEADDTVHMGFFNRDGWVTRTGVPVHESYNKWDPSQPDSNLFEDCGAMSYDGLLHDVPCYQQSLFVCEHEVPTKF